MGKPLRVQERVRYNIKYTLTAFPSLLSLQWSHSVANSIRLWLYWAAYTSVCVYMYQAIHPRIYHKD